MSLFKKCTFLNFYQKPQLYAQPGLSFFLVQPFRLMMSRRLFFAKKSCSRQFSQIVLLQLIYSLLLSILFILFSRISQSHQRLLLLPELHCPRVLLLPHGFHSGCRSGCRHPRDRALYPHPGACRSGRLCRPLFRRMT